MFHLWKLKLKLDNVATITFSRSHRILESAWEEAESIQDFDPQLLE